MKITITMDLTAENLRKLNSLLPEFDSPSETAVETVKPAETPAPTEDPAPATEEKVTKTDVRAVAAKLSKAGKQTELAAIFAKFGCKKLSDFDACPENYPALMKELVSANG